MKNRIPHANECHLGKSLEYTIRFSQHFNKTLTRLIYSGNMDFIIF
jgi:hypothetical protein